MCTSNDWTMAEVFMLRELQEGRFDLQAVETKCALFSVMCSGNLLNVECR